jgi:flavin reductase (DIM6/NTAB) family NADH-FMN oxidoreductase RutF
VLLLVCIDNRSPTHRAIEASRRFVVNVLGEGQELGWDMPSLSGAAPGRSTP